jgi:hypothetical protein
MLSRCIDRGCASLLGGTALFLQIGHRKSIDLNFFTVASFNENELSEYLEGKNSFMVDFLASNTLKGRNDPIS